MPDDFYVVVGENRRLLREVKELRARVTALESSRWWRVHPRFLLRRLSKPAAASEGAVAAPEAVPTAAAQDDDPLLARFRREVVARGSFRDEQSVANARTWEQFLQQLEGREARILEIGSFEGMSACYFLWRLPDAHVTCVDTFAGASSFVARGDDVSGLEAAFDQNVGLVDASRVRKIAADSAHALLELLDEGQRFDLVFVDGSDLALDVMVDACLSWQLLAPGGVMIFDNYIWRSPLGEDPLFQPKPAVDAFLGLVGQNCRVITVSKEAILQRVELAAQSNGDGALAETAP